jgi:hypothetical protein
MNMSEPGKLALTDGQWAFPSLPADCLIAIPIDESEHIPIRGVMSLFYGLALVAGGQYTYQRKMAGIENHN